MKRKAWTLKETIDFLNVKKQKMSMQRTYSKCRDNGLDRDFDSMVQKWQELREDYNKVYAWETRHRDVSYFDMDARTRKTHSLPRNLCKRAYELILHFHGKGPAPNRTERATTSSSEIEELSLIEVPDRMPVVELDPAAAAQRSEDILAQAPRDASGGEDNEGFDNMLCCLEEVETSSMQNSLENIVKQESPVTVHFSQQPPSGDVLAAAMIPYLRTRESEGILPDDGIHFSEQADNNQVYEGPEFFDASLFVDGFLASQEANTCVPPEVKSIEAPVQTIQTAADSEKIARLELQRTELLQKLSTSCALAFAHFSSAVRLIEEALCN